MANNKMHNTINNTINNTIENAKEIENKNNFKNKSKVINIFTVVIFLILLLIIILFLCIKNNLLDNISTNNLSNIEHSEYIYFNDRESYIIDNVSNNFLDNYYGREKTIIVFSASWCKYCVEEQEELNNFITNNPEKKIIIVSHDKSYEELENYLKINNFNWFVIYDKDKTIRNHIDPGSSGIPSSYLLDGQGKIIGYSKGKKTESEFLKFYNN